MTNDNEDSIIEKKLWIAFGISCFVTLIGIWQSTLLTVIALPASIYFLIHTIKACGRRKNNEFKSILDNLQPFESAQLTVYRPSASWNKRMVYDVFINGQKMGKISNGQRVTFSVPSGSYKIKIKENYGLKMRQIAPTIMDFVAGQEKSIVLRLKDNYWLLFILRFALGFLPGIIYVLIVPPYDAEAEFQTAADNSTAQLVVYRPSVGFARLCIYDVLANGQKIGKISNGQSIKFFVPAGRVKIEIYSKQIIRFRQIVPVVMNFVAGQEKSIVLRLKYHYLLWLLIRSVFAIIPGIIYALSVPPYSVKEEIY